MQLTELFENKINTGDENDEDIVTERSRLVFSRKGKNLVKKYKCASGRVVSSAGACPSTRNLLKKNKKYLTSKLFKHHRRSRRHRFKNQ